MTVTSRIEPQFSENALKILEDRYLRNGETPRGVLERVSWGRDDYYEMMARLDFLPNSPTLFNGGTDNGGTSSACFKLDLHDSLLGDEYGLGNGPEKGSIADVVLKSLAIQKFGGGVGYVLSALRPKGSPVRSTQRVSSGPVGFMPLLNAVAESVTQGGVRHGAQMAILHCDHQDLWEFINSKNTEEKANALATFNISVACTDEFMAKWATAPKDKANPLWRMAENAWVTGDPGCYFIDEAERHNPTPWLGLLTGTNPCGEVPLLDNEPCNLGSINLGHFVSPNSLGGFDWPRLEYTVRLATRYLDDVLDRNIFPHPDITAAALNTRKLGLGVMGWADALALLRVHYDSKQAVNMGGEVAQKIRQWAFEESVQLAKEKGVAPCYAGREETYFVRNATRTCQAPTGSISILVNSSGGIEPHFGDDWTRNVGHGKFVLNESRLDSGDFTPHTAQEIAPEWHIAHQAAWQAHTDLATSKTINMPRTATPEQIFDAYTQAWVLKCKGVTVYRDGSRTGQVLVTGSSQVEGLFEPETHQHGRKRLPTERQAITHRFNVGDTEGYMTVGLYPDGNPGELFVTISKAGSTIAGLFDTLGIMTSIALQYGVPVQDLARKFTGVSFAPQGFTDNPEIPNVSSVIDYIFRWMGGRFGAGVASMISGEVCPDCGSLAYHEEGCLKCHSCGWSRC